MKTSRIFILLFLGLIAFAVYFSHQPLPPDPSPVHNLSELKPLPPTPRLAAPVVIPVTPATPPAPTAGNQPTTQPAAPDLATAPDTTLPVTPTSASGKAPILDLQARAALSLVGTDPDAEAYWLEAINDPTLPAQERQDLIEDLNEDGISNPDHPGPQDLPLIESRLLILRELANDPLDNVNARAIAEATKDLSNMYADLTAR